MFKDWKEDNKIISIFKWYDCLLENPKNIQKISATKSQDQSSMYKLHFYITAEITTK